MKVKSFLLCTVGVLLVLLTSSCATTVSCRTLGKRGYGPPPHAPAHGHRRKLPSKVEVVFDSDCGVYVVVGLERHFWLDGQYYRFHNGQWQFSIGIESGWQVIGEEKLPPGLRKKYKARHVSKKHQGRAKGHNKDKW